MKKGRKKVFVGMSGGVDSSVAAYLLQQQGFDLVGVFLKSYNVDGCEERDAEDARRVAEHLKIPFYVFDMREEYFSLVVAEMIEGYRNGITPNPDILCNREIKFGLFWERAKKLGADAIATGHYAQIKNKKLLAGVDKNKDQSYFLWKLKEEDLSHSLFPIGGYGKPVVRKIAKKAGLPTAEKKDSQGICFLGKVKLPEFLKKYMNEKSGDIVDTEGNVIGKHDGAHFYTIGQRHIGANIKYQKSNVKKIEDRKPYYIAEKDVEKNILIVAEGEKHPALYKKEIQLVDMNFINKQNFKNLKITKLKIYCRVRYRQPLQKAELWNKAGKWHVVFEHPVKFVARGQSAVFYKQNGEVLGGGVIL